MGPISNPLHPDGKGSKPLNTLYSTGHGIQAMGMQCVGKDAIGQQQTSVWQSTTSFISGVPSSIGSLFSGNSADNTVVLASTTSKVNKGMTTPTASSETGASLPLHTLSIHTLYLPPQWWYRSPFTLMNVLKCMIPLAAAILFVKLLCIRYVIVFPQLKRKRSPAPSPIQSSTPPKDIRNFMSIANGMHDALNDSTGRHVRSHSFNLVKSDSMEDIQAEAYTSQSQPSIYNHTNGVGRSHPPRYEQQGSTNGYSNSRGYNHISIDTPNSRRRSNRFSNTTFNNKYSSPSSPGLSYRAAASPKSTLSLNMGAIG
jgi:hypothetical protein